MIKMFDRTRRARLVLAVLLTASVTIITIDFRTEGEGPLDKIGRAAMTVIGPVQEGLTTIFRPVGNFFAGFTKVPSLRARVAELEQQVATLEAEARQFEDIVRENESLRQQLDLAARLNLRTQSARVVGVSPSNFERTVFIDQGASEGVEVDMPVIAGAGLVGRVIQVGKSSAQVALLTDPSSAVASRLVTNGKTGVLEGTGAGSLRLELLDPTTEVAAGDKVVTSGYDRGLFPPGIPVGTVIDAPPAGSYLTRAVTVQPFVDFSSLDYVLLVIGQRRTVEEPRS